MNEGELQAFFQGRRFETQSIRDRGPPLPLNVIPKDDRYLISEMACKSYGDDARSHLKAGGGAITVKQLLEGDIGKGKFKARQQEFLFSATDDVPPSLSSRRV